MASLRNDQVVARPASEVWERIADVGSIASWFPSFASSRLDADGHRRIKLANGFELDEEIVAVDPVARRLQYRIIAGLPVLRAHHATVDVISVDDRSVVVYSTEVDPPALSWILGGVIEEALVELDRQLTAAAG